MVVRRFGRVAQGGVSQQAKGDFAMNDGSHDGLRDNRGRLMTRMNLVLAGAVVGLVVVGMAGAQATQARRIGGQYTCVGGKTLGGYTNVIYVLDSANREMVALKWNDATKQLEGVGYRDLDEDITKENDR